MGILDLTLSVIAVLLWANWQMGLSADQKKRVTDLGHVGRTISHKAEPVFSWKTLLPLVAILFLRPFIYWQIGMGIEWNAMLKFGAVSIPFRSDNLLHMMVFSLAGFAQILLIFYSWILFLGLVNYGDNVNENNLLHKGIHIFTKPVIKWPVIFRILLPGMVTAPLWFLFCLILEKINIFPVQTLKSVFCESLVMGLCAYLPWCHLLALLIFIYFLNSYIYLGGSPIWNYLHFFTRKILTPLYFLPLQISKIDFTPVAGMAIVFLIYENAVKGLSILFTYALR